MIKLTLRWMQRFAEIEFPCSDSELQEKLSQLRPSDTSPDEIFVLSVHQPTALSMLEDQFLDMDEVNFLAKRMESFTYDELLQFYAAAQYEGLHYPKDLINLTYNLPCYTVIHDLRNIEAIGKAHYMNINGAVSAAELKRIDFAAIGRNLIRSGNGCPTEFGLLFKNQEIPCEEIYDGAHFPEYDHSGCLLVASVEMRGQTEYLYLPCEELSIQKALHRIGATCEDDAHTQVEDIHIDSQEWLDHLKNLLRREGIHAVNQVAEAISIADMDLGKLSAVIEYAEVDTADAIVALAKNQDKFVFIPNVTTPTEVAMDTIASIDVYKLHPHLQNFFDYERFGQHIADLYEGRFVNGGFICMDDEAYLEEILADTQDQGMGGM